MIRERVNCNYASFCWSQCGDTSGVLVFNIALLRREEYGPSLKCCGLEWFSESRDLVQQKVVRKQPRAEIRFGCFEKQKL